MSTQSAWRNPFNPHISRNFGNSSSGIWSCGSGRRQHKLLEKKLVGLVSLSRLQVCLGIDLRSCELLWGHLSIWKAVVARRSLHQMEGEKVFQEGSLQGHESLYRLLSAELPPHVFQVGPPKLALFSFIRSTKSSGSGLLEFEHSSNGFCRRVLAFSKPSLFYHVLQSRFLIAYQNGCENL